MTDTLQYIVFYYTKPCNLKIKFLNLHLYKETLNLCSII